jgi:hypothetical protein
VLKGANVSIAPRHTINDERVRMELTRRTFLGVAGAVTALATSVISPTAESPAVAAATTEEPGTDAALAATGYSAIVGVL